MSIGSKKSIYVVGFPKSGNTWLARLLADVTQSNIDATNLVDAADNLLGRQGDYLIHKVHDCNKLPRSDGTMIVYVVRDIRDVLVSAFFFNNKFVQEEWISGNSEKHGVRRSFYMAYFKRQIRRMNKCWTGNELSVLINRLKGNRNRLGGWSEHIENCTQSRQALIVRYEDLLEDAIKEVRKVGDFLSLQVSQQQISAAVENQSFEKRKKQFLNSGDSKNAKFLRSGRSGGYRNFLTPELLREIEKEHGRTMCKFGYDLDYFECSSWSTGQTDPGLRPQRGFGTSSQKQNARSV